MPLHKSEAELRRDLRGHATWVQASAAMLAARDGQGIKAKLRYHHSQLERSVLDWFRRHCAKIAHFLCSLVTWQPWTLWSTVQQAQRRLHRQRLAHHSQQAHGALLLVRLPVHLLALRCHALQG